MTMRRINPEQDFKTQDDVLKDFLEAIKNSDFNNSFLTAVFTTRNTTDGEEDHDFAVSGISIGSISNNEIPTHLGRMFEMLYMIMLHYCDHNHKEAEERCFLLFKMAIKNTKKEMDENNGQNHGKLLN